MILSRPSCSPARLPTGGGAPPRRELMLMPRLGFQASASGTRRSALPCASFEGYDPRDFAVELLLVS